MSTPTINDLDSVKALLEQLRGSQAWQELSKPPLSTDGELAQAQDASNEEEAREKGPDSGPSLAKPEEDSSPSVASLLAQLHTVPSSTSSSAISSRSPFSGHQASRYPGGYQSLTTSLAPSAPITQTGIPHNDIAPLSPPSQDRRSFSFQQTLPILSQLAENPAFVSSVNQMKKEQDDLERNLWQDRRNIYRKYEEKVRVAQTKATLVGDSGLSKHEAEMLQAGLKKELEKFDRERVLVAWDGLIVKQQASLAQLGVPTMFATEASADREKQQKVMQVLEGFL